MILERRSILFVLVLRLFCALCDDDVLASQAVTVPAESSHDSGSTESFESSVYTGSTDDLTSFASDESGSTDGSTRISTYESTITTTYESTIGHELSTTDSQSKTNIDGSSSLLTVDLTTQTEPTTTTVRNDVTSTENSVNDTTICDPMWPDVNTSDTREVINLKIDGISTEWITLSWEPPCKNATNVSVIYSIDQYDGKKFKQANKTVTWHNATDLDPCTQYTFTVKVLTEFGPSDGDTRSATTDNAISEIGDVLSLSVHNVSVNAIQLTWQAPLVSAKCISNYLIAQCDEKSCNETTVSATNYTANDLEPCTEYHFTVKTVTPTVQSVGVNETAKTASPKLPAPQSPEVIPGNFSLMIKWQPPETGNTCLKHYHITIEDATIDHDIEKSLIPQKTFNTTNNVTEIMILELHACVTYQLYISAVNEDDVEGDTVPCSNTTNRYRTNPPISKNTGIIPHARNISMVWSIEKENNHCLLTSIITVCNFTQNGWKGCEPNSSFNITYIDPKKAAGPLVTIDTVVDNLTPYTPYTCYAYTFNAAEYSEISNEINATTLEDVPFPPTLHHVKSIKDMQFFLSWDLPECVTGKIEEFEIIMDWRPLYPVPDWCIHDEQDDENSIKYNVNGTESNYNISAGKPFTNYTIRIKAKTAAGWGDYGTPQIVQSESAVSDAISKFNSSSIIIKENPNNSNTLDTILTWGLPCSLNGEFEIFNVSVYGTRDNFPPHIFYILHDCADYMDNDYMCSVNLNELKGEYNYTFTISTKVMDIDSLGLMTSQSKLYPAGIPPQPDDEYVRWITIDPYKASRTTTTATILLPLFLDLNGKIKYYAIMVSEKGHNSKPSNTRFDLTSNTWPNTSSWEEAMKTDFSITYQATWREWNPNLTNNVADYGHLKAVKYTIGEDTTCMEISSNTDKPMYCNGPLKPDTWYHVRMRAFTSGGYTDSDIFVVKTNAELNVALVIGAVFGILFMGILVTMMLLVRKCSPHIVLRRFLHSDMPGSPVPAPYTRKKFISHCQQLVDNPGKLSNEFRLLQTLSVDLQMPTNTACLQANRKKNRYSDILPYDFSRVKLEVIDNDPNTDYINASFIRGYTGEDEYIACQGPKEETTYDFWRMVNQYNINIIIMLTQLVEKGKEKCHQYYPAIRETFRYENMTIRCTSELDFRTYTQRTLVLQKENKKRNITHLHFKDWPDHDVPEDFDPMIQFCQIMRRNISANKDFIVVHCSAGIGRTGTLIAIDILLQHLRDNRKLDVFGTVYRLRHNRINMVQRESQYAYIYNCIKQVLKNPYCLKTYKPPPVDPVYENISKKAKAKDTMNLDLVNNLEILKKYRTSISMESLESMYSLFPWSSARYQRNTKTINSGLRQYKSMGAINVKTHHIAIGKTQTLDCVYYKTLKDSSNKSNSEITESIESLTKESFPLLTNSTSADVLDNNMQYTSTM